MFGSASLFRYRIWWWWWWWWWWWTNEL